MNQFTKTRNMKLSAAILEEASVWFVEFSEGEVDAAGRENFNQWLRTSPEHIRAYLQISALWEDAHLLSNGRMGSGEELAAQALAEANIVNFSTHRPNNTGAAASSDTRLPRVATVAAPKSLLGQLHDRANGWAPLFSRLRLGWSLAATAVLAVAASIAWLQLEPVVYATQIGEQRSLLLADGSTVELNARSQIRVRFSRGERAVDLLQGQALFHVSKDAARPFVVYSEAARVRAVGTQFDVYRKVFGTVITVLEGRVAILPDGVKFKALALKNEPPTESDTSSDRTPPAQRSAGSVPRAGEGPAAGPSRDAVPPGNEATQSLLGEQASEDIRSRSEGPIFLTAGQQVIVTAQAIPHPASVNVETATAWTQRRLVFASSSMAEVAEEYNRYNTRPLRIRSGQLGDFHVSGVFSASDSASLLAFLRAQPNLVVRETRSEIEIYAR